MERTGYHIVFSLTTFAIIYRDKSRRKFKFMDCESENFKEYADRSGYFANNLLKVYITDLNECI